MRIQFYQNSSDAARVRKAIFPQSNAINCKIKEGTSMLEPTVILGSDIAPFWANSNYFYIDTYKRFYYLQDVITDVGGIIYVSGSVDVLMSNAAAIINTTAMVIKNEFKFDDMLVDPDICIRQGRRVSYQKIGNISSEMTYYMTVSGGDATDKKVTTKSFVDENVSRETLDERKEDE